MFVFCSIVDDPEVRNRCVSVDGMSPKIVDTFRNKTKKKKCSNSH